MTCGRCGMTDPRELRTALVNRHREQRADGRPIEGAEYGVETRCKDRERCRERARRGAA